VVPVDAEQLCLLLDPFDPPHNQSAGDVSGRAAPGEGDVIGFGDLRDGDPVAAAARPGRLPTPRSDT
jgi:hypothetical protein